VRAVSASRFSGFGETEKAVQKQNFGTFFTSKEPNVYHHENRFEGKSSYLSYFPTGEVFEQQLEKLWIEDRHRELAEKRREEEARELMKDWGMARGRVESEIARKKEHLGVATNFEQVRGWVRRTDKLKQPQPAQTMEEFLASSSEEEAERSPQKEQSPAKVDFHPEEPQVVDFTEDPNSLNVRPTTKQLAFQLNAIEQFNYKLPPRKKDKESLPEIAAPNVACKSVQIMDAKKGLEMKRKYHNVGAVDEVRLHKDQPQDSVEGFSLAAQHKQQKTEASKQRIACLRKHYGKLIGATDSKNERAENNPFAGLERGK
jgi:hypothetical protein